jgi:hypothetical protein
MEHTHAYGRPTPGLVIAWIGVLHQFVGFILGRQQLLDLWNSGVIGQAEADPLRMALVWFLLFGFLLIFCGMALHRLETLGAKLTTGVALGFASLCLLGIVLMPVSGFWLGLIPAFQIWHRAGANQVPQR